MDKIEKVSDFIQLRRQGLLKGVSLGLVPTMGTLHQGHLSLVKESLKDNQKTVVSIFVNKTQFNNEQDFQNYPQHLESDLMKLKKVGVDYVLCPRFDELYPDEYRFKVSESQNSQILCGAHRPGHFEGVLSVVLKLMQITTPQKSYFGEKDYQQLKLIQDLSEAFFLKGQVIGVPTLREKDGLAMSSRNLNLSAADRKKAPFIYQLLSEKTNSCEAIRNTLEKKGFQVDYVEEHWGRRFAAATIGQVRLIDNVKL